ncbi:MAG: helix-turn-helix domain-containing protein [Oscillospiraceae bacterium]|nr:helix-turn-helix domain-containing protein [Oscillospiraceae bacterium]
MTTGERIRTVRKKKGLTQKQLADRCGMADSAIRKYESGRINPKLETIHRIATALNSDLLEFIDILPGDNNPKSVELAHELTEKFGNARKAGKRVAFHDGALQLEEDDTGDISSSNQLLEMLTAKYSKSQDLEELVSSIMELRELSRDEWDNLLALSIKRICDIAQRDAISAGENEKPVTPHTEGPQTAPAPQKDKDTTLAQSGPETAPEGE